MATCKECIHDPMCQALADGNGIPKIGPLHCGYFDPRSQYVKKPCEVGAEIFGILEVSGTERVFRGVVRRIAVDKEGVWLDIHFLAGLNCWEVASQIDKTLFFSEEDARKALAEEKVS